jgi:hypothetical protein
MMPASVVRMNFLVLSTLIMLFIANISAFAERRLALVIGNAEYQFTEPLRQPAEDAKAFAEFLDKNGFEVTTVIDADRAAMSTTIAAFVKGITPKDVALFYFSGHGMQQEGLNFLIPVDAKLQSQFGVPSETISLNAVIAALERSAKIVFIIIDASRANPLADRLRPQQQAPGTMAVHGLARIEPSGTTTMVALAAKPGEVALDGAGQSSLFTGGLIQYLATPGIEVSTAFKRVIHEVRKATQDGQSPQMVSNLADEFYLDDGSKQVAANQEQAKRDYEKAERIRNVRAWQLFLNRYPTGFYADLARGELGRLVARDPSLALSPEGGEKSLKLDETRIKEVELALQFAGVVVSPDGRLSKAEREQIASYQMSLGLADTGFLDQTLLGMLKVSISTSEADVVAMAGEARTYNASDLEGLEKDQQLIEAVRCLSPREITYGFYRGHIYIAVQKFNTSWTESNATAIRCKGHLVTFSDRREEKFVIALFEQDDRFVDESGGGGWVDFNGPWIGLVQDPKGREPGGGWHWVTGEPLRYKNWLVDQPNENTKGADVAKFVAQTRSGSGKKLIPNAWDDSPAGDAGGFIMELELLGVSTRESLETKSSRYGNEGLRNSGHVGIPLQF